jgi:hypothetical protein
MHIKSIAQPCAEYRSGGACPHCRPNETKRPSGRPWSGESERIHIPLQAIDLPAADRRAYTVVEIRPWLAVFFKQFISKQFKRSSCPPVRRFRPPARCRAGATGGHPHIATQRSGLRDSGKTGARGLIGGACSPGGPDLIPVNSNPARRWQNDFCIAQAEQNHGLLSSAGHRPRLSSGIRCN